MFGLAADLICSASSLSLFGVLSLYFAGSGLLFWFNGCLNWDEGG